MPSVVTHNNYEGAIEVKCSVTVPGKETRAGATSCVSKDQMQSFHQSLGGLTVSAKNSNLKILTQSSAVSP